MGESKRRKTEALVKGITAMATDDGKVIELGWLALRAQAVAKDAPQVQLDEMRMAFFAGAQHLFASIMTVLDPESEPTARDLRRMDGIASELDAFIVDFSAKYIPTRGEA